MAPKYQFILHLCPINMCAIVLCVASAWPKVFKRIEFENREEQLLQTLISSSTHSTDLAVEVKREIGKRTDIDESWQKQEMHTFVAAVRLFAQENQRVWRGEWRD